MCGVLMGGLLYGTTVSAISYLAFSAPGMGSSLMCTNTPRLNSKPVEARVAPPNVVLYFLVGVVCSFSGGVVFFSIYPISETFLAFVKE